MKLTAISAFLALLAAVPAVANNVLSVSDASMTPTAIMPQSAETDTRKMLENWYLQNYTVLDTEADSRESAELTDEIIMDRLSRLPVSIEMPFNSVVGNSIRFYAKRRQLVENMLGLSIYYMPIFEEALERHGLPRELRYLPVIESALVPTAKSRAGAGGLWQFMPATGAGLGLEQNSLVDMRFDPYKSSEAAAIYLKQLYSTYNDWSLAIAAYNCGPGNVNKAIRRAGGGKKDFWEIYPFLLPETRGYVPAFIAANYIMTYHKNHNISPVLARRPIVVDTVHVSRRVHFDQISEVLDIPMEELRALNPQYRRDIIPGDIKPYPLTLPSLQAYAYVANEDSIVNHNASRYARRGVVEPSTGAVTGSDSRGEYVEEETIQWHKVRRGETLTSIARRYGTTVREIRRLNNCGKRVATGKRLKIKTVVRHYKERTHSGTDRHHSFRRIVHACRLRQPGLRLGQRRSGCRRQHRRRIRGRSLCRRRQRAFGRNSTGHCRYAGETGREPEQDSTPLRNHGACHTARQQSHQHQSPDWPAAYNPTVTSNPNTIAL